MPSQSNLPAQRPDPKYKATLAGLAGIVLGFLAGSIGVYYACMLYDKINYPEGVPTGGGLMAVGWVFWLFTIPVGTIFGGIFGYCLIRKRQKKKRSPAKPEASI